MIFSSRSHATSLLNFISSIHTTLGMVYIRSPGLVCILIRLYTCNIIIRYKECGKADGKNQPGQGEGQRYSLVSRTSGQE